jgi:hypothetical protein
MKACSLSLGHPWEFDTDTVHYGRANKYTLVHDGKKITLLPLTPNKIVQCDRAIAETAKRESEIQHDQTTRSKLIKMCKVQWSHHTEDEATREHEEELRADYPDLFPSAS